MNFIRKIVFSKKIELVINNHTEEDWKDYRKWIGKVVGNEKSIQEALVILGREPKDAKELEKLILKRSREMLQKTLREAYEEEQKLYKLDSSMSKKSKL